MEGCGFRTHFWRGSGTFYASDFGRGTTCYPAPELLTQNEYNNKIDIWAIGCILYELATFKKAFQSDINLYRYTLGQIPFEVVLTDFDEETAVGIKQIILKILRLEPRSRPSARELVKEFTELAEANPRENVPGVTIHQEFRHSDVSLSTVVTSDPEGMSPFRSAADKKPSRSLHWVLLH
jgi:serine/threonine protein kinase